MQHFFLDVISISKEEITATKIKKNYRNKMEAPNQNLNH